MTLRRLILPLIVLGSAASLSACFQQDTATPTSAPLEAPAKYNAALAKELGADDRGMRPYVMVILKTGPNDKTVTDEAERAKIFAGHFDNIRALAEDKKLVLAGPFSDPEGIKRGLYIFNVKTVEDAKSLVMSDPAVEAGIFTPEFTPYYGSAALMQVNEVHETIAKTNP